MAGSKKYRHAFTLLFYVALYLICFYYLENSVTKYNIIHVGIDDYIPFCEYFIVPYILWFPYIFFVTAYFCLADRPGFTKLASFLMIGMTIFLIVSFIYPNGQDLRLQSFGRDNIFVDLVKYIYANDTPTNILPSIHVLNTTGVQIAIWTDERLKTKKWIIILSGILSTLIIMSTVFIKQHSMFDVLLALGLAIVMYALLYREDYLNHFEQLKKKRSVLSNTSDYKY